MLHTYRDVPGTLSLRFLWRIFILELGLFLETVSRCFQDNANYRTETETPVMFTIIAFRFPWSGQQIIFYQ
jgi:hypothetical protein